MIQLEKNRKKIPTKLINIVWLIKVIELSGVQFGLKYARDFKTNAQNEFVLKSQVWFEMHDLHEMKFSLPLYCIHFKLQNSVAQIQDF